MAAADIECNKVIKWDSQDVCHVFSVDSVLKYPVSCLICPEKLKIEPNVRGRERWDCSIFFLFPKDNYITNQVAFQFKNLLASLQSFIYHVAMINNPQLTISGKSWKISSISF